jgi:copper homeostasis protein
MENAISLGIERILTSGQAANAIEGADLIAELISRASQRIIIMPGGGITEYNVLGLIKKTGAREVHASLRSLVKSRMQFRNGKVFMGLNSEDQYTWTETDPERVRNFIKRLNKSPL